MSPVTECARAKINLTLKIVGRRADGYHLLESLIAFAAVGDDVRYTPGVTATVSTSGPFADAIAGDNLADIALQRLAERDASLQLGHVEIEKRLPIAAGIGGGSADAAAVLRAVRTGNPAAHIDWNALAASLGADVPVCLANRTSRVWGIGEHIEPVAGLPRLAAVLVCPLRSSPFGKTRAVFAGLDLATIAEGSRESPPEQLPALTDVAALVAHMRNVGNDLRASAHVLMPESAVAEAALATEPGCLYATLSGAGPTSYGIFADAENAATAAERLSARYPDWWVVSTTIGD